MINLRRMTNYDVLHEGQRLLKMASGEESLAFELAAQYLTDTLYHNFVGDDERPIFALVRLFRLCSYEALSPELQTTVQAKDSPFMLLFGSFGLEEAWQDPKESQKSQVVKPDNPMMAAALSAIGLSINPPPSENIDTDKTIQRHIFFVPSASESASIPDQKDFVEPYKIASVIGIGDSLPSGAIFLLIAFSLVSLNRADAQKFQSLLPVVSSILAKHETLLWDDLGL